MTPGKLVTNLFSLQFSTDAGVSYDAAAHGKSLTLNFDRTEINVTNMDSADAEEFLMGNKSFTASYNSLLQFEDVTDKLNPDDLFSLWAAGTLAKLKFTTGVTGDIYWQGDVYIKGGSIGGQHGDAMDVSFELRGTGGLTQATVA
jgi:predicted secreted protein